MTLTLNNVTLEVSLDISDPDQLHEQHLLGISLAFLETHYVICIDPTRRHTHTCICFSRMFW